MPDLSIVITESKEVWTCRACPGIHHESGADCERGREVSFLKRGVCVAVVLVWFLIIVQRKIKSLQRGAEGNGAVLFFMFRISGVTLHLGLGSFSIGITTEIVISHVGETMIVRLSV